MEKPVFISPQFSREPPGYGRLTFLENVTRVLGSFFIIRVVVVRAT
jgi:hypothetical protein